MRKILLLLAVMLTVVCENYAQGHKNGIGLRVGDGVELQYERHFTQKNYIKLNLGMLGYDSGFFATGTYNWNCFKWDWTPKVGTWFMSAGVGASVGMYDDDFNLGIAGDVAFGLHFKQPFTLAVDYRPTLLIFDHQGRGLYNFAISCVYRF